MNGMRRPIPGIQLYTLRDHTKTAEDFDTTLGRLAALGVKDVQLSAVGPIDAAVQRKIMDKYEIRPCVTHRPFGRIRDDLPALIEEHRILGCDALGLGWAPQEQRESEQDARAFVQTLQRAADTLARHGMTLHYHNHDFEFAPLPGSDKSLMDLMLSETDPASFGFIPDVAWAHFAGLDPAAFLQMLRGRVKVVHFKDYVPGQNGRPQFVSLGQGVVDLKACYDVCCELEMPFVMYEQDDSWTNGDPFVATEESWRFLQELHG